MDIRMKIRQALREQYGEFNTHLEHIYEEKVTDNLASGNKKDKEAWSTYNQVVLELKHSIKDNLKDILVQQLQYRLTDNEPPPNACIDVINQVWNKTPELERLLIKISNF